LVYSVSMKIIFTLKPYGSFDQNEKNLEKN